LGLKGVLSALKGGKTRAEKRGPGRTWKGLHVEPSKLWETPGFSPDGAMGSIRGGSCKTVEREPLKKYRKGGGGTRDSGW